MYGLFNRAQAAKTLIADLLSPNGNYLGISRLMIYYLIISVIGSCIVFLLQDRPQNHCLIQAEAFLKGQLNIDFQLHDTVDYQGRYYLVNPPFPSMILIPVVAIFGSTIGVGGNLLCSVFLTAMTISSLYKTYTSLGVNSKESAWLVLGFIFGTGYWYCSIASTGMWQWAHVVAVFCLVMSIEQSLRKGNGLLSGLFLGLAFLSRQMTIYAAFFLLVSLWKHQNNLYLKQKILQILYFCFVVGSAITFYLWFNWIRFGDPFDTGYSLLLQPDVHLNYRQTEFGLFNLIYIPVNLLNLFVQGFRVEFNDLTHWHMSHFATSLTYASPFVFFAMRAIWEKHLKLAAWISILFTVFHILLYHADGWIQINTYRYTLDFLPVLMILVAFGIKEKEQLAKVVISYSIALNAIALFYLPLFSQ